MMLYVFLPLPLQKFLSTLLVTEVALFGSPNLAAIHSRDKNDAETESRRISNYPCVCKKKKSQDVAISYVIRVVVVLL